MTLDPTLDFNPGLPDVSNVHNADGVIHCSSHVDFAHAPYRTTLAEGRVVEGEGSSWPFTVGTDSSETDIPATLRQSRVGTSGEAMVVVDNRAAIDSVIRQNNRRVNIPWSGGGGCSVGRPSGAGVAWASALVGLALFRRRRRS